MTRATRLLLAALVFVLVRQLDATPSSGQTTAPVDMSGTLSAAQSGAPHEREGDTVSPMDRHDGDAPQPTGDIGTALLGGWATWHDNGPGMYAAAGPDLRRALGPGWRGTVVEVGGPGGASVRVRLTDSCACGERHGLPTFLDLSADAFAQLAPLDWGVVAVSIELVPVLPATNTGGEP
jgi:hypothetical protein